MGELHVRHGPKISVTGGSSQAIAHRFQLTEEGL